MFVLSNAWRALMRSKGRTALTALIALAVTFGTVVGLAVIQEHDKAHGTDYNLQKATMAIRPNASAWKEVSATDPSSTKHYMTWESYTDYATIMQTSGITLDFMVTETVPARATGDIKALDGGSLKASDDDKSGGQLLWRAFWTKDSAKVNDLGTYTIADGKGLDYNTQSSDADTTSALISKVFASANGLKVGDKFKVATAADKSKTVELTVRGIYEYTSEANPDNPVAAARNRENAIYTNYPTFAAAGLDPQSADKADGWSLPDLNVVFNLTDAATYKTTLATLKKAKLPAKGFTISSPSLNAYNESLKPLDALADTAGTAVPLLLAVGGVLLLALQLAGVWSRKRDDEFGMALVCGVSRGRLAWQLMLETLIVLLPLYAIGLAAGIATAKPIGAALAGGHATAVQTDLIWKMVWYGLGAVAVLAILVGLRAAFFSPIRLFAAAGNWGTVESAPLTADDNTSTTTDEDAEAQA